MKGKTLKKKSRALLVGAVLLCLSGCGNQAKATTMYLVRTEGTVGVTDEDQKDVALIDQLGLYSGYEVGTRTQSYAWIDLDDVKEFPQNLPRRFPLATDCIPYFLRHNSPPYDALAPEPPLFL